MNFRIKDFTIEKFNNDVNNSGDLDRKYSEWTEYRNRISGFISDTIKNKKLENIFVMGAGECNDVDLHFLSSRFEKIVLCDIDVQSIHDGVKRQSIADIDGDRISTVKADFTGLEEIEFFEKLSQMTSRKESTEVISKYIGEATESIKVENILREHCSKYDAVLALPTYTQLAYTQMETLLRILYEYSIYPIDDLNKILTAMHHAMPKLIDNYNELILSVLKDEGMLIVLSDVMEITDRNTLDSISDKLGETRYIKQYLDNDSTEFGMMGIEKIQTRIETTNYRYDIWPFDETRKYLVQFISGRKNKQ